MVKITRVTAGIEAHWSLANLLRDNWGWIVSTIGLAGFNGGMVWLWQAALDASWYQQALVISSVILVTTFFILGIKAFLTWMRRSQREDGAIALGIASSGYTYGPGAVIDGGTHSIAEIFGRAQTVSNVLFRNCTIIGPGVVLFANSPTSHCTFWDLPAPQKILGFTAGDVLIHCHQFFQCRFENCTITKLIQIDSIPLQPSGQWVYYALKSVSHSEAVEMLRQSQQGIEQKTPP
jgi:hypothetical protein